MKTSENLFTNNAMNFEKLKENIHTMQHTKKNSLVIDAKLIRLSVFCKHTMEIKEFEQRLKRYALDVDKASSREASRAYLFLEFIRDIFRDVVINNPHNLYPDLEKTIKSEKTLLIKGRVDWFLGNLIIEFESNLTEPKREEATGQLKKYCAILWNNLGIVEYLCVATDGFEFLIYRPRSSKTQDFGENDIVLETVDKFDIREEDPTIIFKQLDRYMLYQTLRKPVADDIVNDFGSKSIILKDCMTMLTKAWADIKTEALAIYNEWAKYLSIVYGTEVQNEELFLKHTYLATLAKLMVYSYYQANTLPTSREIINQILTGVVFREYGIENFLVEDFFSWIVKDKVNRQGIQIVNRILDGLSMYNLMELNEDVFKELYQQLVDPVERHDLGEYYTPDWLAERIVKQVAKDPEARVLDPSCGSGTFLAATIRHKLSLMQKQKTPEKVGLIVQTVYGIDVHPLAVLISKANYLMALGNLLSKKMGNVVIPVYMADSIIFPVPIHSVAAFGKAGSEEVYLYKVDERTNLVLPRSLVDSNIADGIVDSMRDFALKMLNEPSISTKGFQTYLEKKFGINKEQFDVILDTANKLVDLIKNNKDTIHSFILKNIYKPSTIGKFDIIVGNPPWLSYRYIKSLDRQEQIRNLVIKQYNLFDTSGGRTVSNLELATLFFIMISDLYLHDKGLIAFVMPRSVFSSEHHDEFRKEAFTKTKLGIEEVWDLEDLAPLFNVPSCVLIARKGSSTKYPVCAKIIRGELTHKNASLKDFGHALEKKHVTITESKIKVMHVGDRSSWIYQSTVICGGRNVKTGHSEYKDKIKRGAELIPRPLWFVEVKKHERFGVDLQEPYLETTKRSTEMAKGEYKGIILSGKVEGSYLYATLLGSDIIPFCHLKFRPIILPLLSLSKSYQMIRASDATNKGHSGLSDWLERAEEIWNKRRKEKVQKWDLYGLLDFRKQLTMQDPSIPFKVLYNTSGTFLSACVVDLSKQLLFNVDGMSLKLQGFLADTTTYYFETTSDDEAFYLTSILNSTIIDTLLKPLQAKGAFGERHIHKKPFELPMIKFNSENKIHKKLVTVGKESTRKAESALPQLLEKMKIEPTLISPNAVGRLRNKIREILDAEIAEIDDLVCEIITE